MELSKDKKLAIQALRMSPGYDALLDIMEAKCQLTETELLKADPGDPDKVRGLHARAQAGRMFFESVQSMVNFVVGELKAAPEKEVSLEELLRNYA